MGFDHETPLTHHLNLADLKDLQLPTLENQDNITCHSGAAPPNPMKARLYCFRIYIILRRTIKFQVQETLLLFTFLSEDVISSEPPQATVSMRKPPDKALRRDISRLMTCWSVGLGRLETSKRERLPSWYSTALQGKSDSISLYSIRLPIRRGKHRNGKMHFVERAVTYKIQVEPQ